MTFLPIILNLYFILYAFLILDIRQTFNTRFFRRRLQHSKEAEEKSYFSFKILSYLCYYGNLFMYSTWKHIYNIMFLNLTLVKICFKRISTSRMFNMKPENFSKLCEKHLSKFRNFNASEKA